MLIKNYKYLLLFFACIYTFNIIAKESVDEGIFVTDVKVVESTIVSIDPKERTIVLRDDQGQEYPVKVIPKIKDFANIEVGDMVRLEFNEKFEVYLASPEEKIGGSLESNLIVPNTIKQLTTGTDTYEEIYLVSNINIENRIVSLKKADGQTLTVKVDEDVKGLDKLKVDDKIKSIYTRTVNISLIKNP